MLHHKSSPQRRVVALLAAAIMIAVLATGCGKKESKDEFPGSSEGKVVATYKDGGQVTDVEFKKYSGLMQLVNPQMAMYMQLMQEESLKQYITYKVFAKRATEEQVKTAGEQADEITKQLEDAAKTQTEMKDMMKQSDISFAEVKKFIVQMVAAETVINAKQTEFAGQVKDEETKAEYDKNPSDFNIVSVRHILINVSNPSTGEEVRKDEEALKIAKEVKAKLDAGGDWKELAKQYSEDEGSKENGGLYEKQKAGGWVQAFKDAANKQAIGVVGDPVKSEFGYHVMKVESRTETPYDKLEQTDKDGLKNAVASAKLSTYMTGEQDALGIKIDLPKDPEPSGSAPSSESPSESPSASPSSSASASQ